jgi:hypothetical protein
MAARTSNGDNMARSYSNEPDYAMSVDELFHSIETNLAELREMYATSPGDLGPKDYSRLIMVESILGEMNGDDGWV